MPTPLIKKYAQQAKTTEKHVEEVWEKAKEIAKQRFGGTSSPQYWAYVNGIVQRTLKLKEGKITFKELLDEGSAAREDQGTYR